MNMSCRIKNVVFGHEVWTLQTCVGVRRAVGPSGEVRPGAIELKPSVFTEAQGTVFPSRANKY